MQQVAVLSLITLTIVLIVVIFTLEVDYIDIGEWC
jgi:hypothetical protein